MSQAARIEPDAVGLRLHRELARSLYARAVRLESRLGADALEGKPWLADARRSVQRMIDLLQEDETTLLGLTAVKALAPAGSARVVRTHAANVAILSILLGREAKLNRVALAEVGLAGLLHDIGVDATGERAMHGLHGAECVLQLGPFESVVCAALVALVHHDARQEIPNAERDAATAIVQIADAYDALTAHGLRPDKVLHFLLEQGKNRFDPVLVKLFVQALGAYPPGCGVELENGDVGVVLRACRDRRTLDRPLVRLLKDASGKTFQNLATIDLAARDAHGGYSRYIAQAVDTRRLGSAPAAVFLGTV